MTYLTKGAGTLRRAVRSQDFCQDSRWTAHGMCLLLCGRHMECAYYFVDGTWNVPTTLTFDGCVQQGSRY
jgi:hypothetical protein